MPGENGADSLARSAIGPRRRSAVLRQHVQEPQAYRPETGPLEISPAIPDIVVVERVDGRSWRSVAAPRGSVPDHRKPRPGAMQR